MIYEITLNQSFAGQRCVNRFYYSTPSSGIDSTASALELLDVFGLIPDAGVFPNTAPFEFLRSIQHQEVTTVSAFCRAMYNPFDFHEEAYGTPPAGLLTTGQSMPPFVAAGMYSARARLDIRRGYKRFVGVPEASSDSGGILTTTYRNSIQALGDELGTTLTDADTNYIPQILGLEKIIDPPNPVKYLLYETEAEQREHMYVPVYTAYPQTRSQISRQYGRGT